MKPQKKAIIAQKAAKTPVAKKHQILLKKTVAELKKVKNFKKTVKPEDLKQKLENKRKMEEKKKSTDKKKADDKKEKPDKAEDKKKQAKEAGDKKLDKTSDKKGDEKIIEEDDKKKKAEDKVKAEKQPSDVKKKGEDKKRIAKDSETDQSSLSSSCTEDNETVDNKPDTPIFCTKKKTNDKKAKSAKSVTAKKVEKKKDGDIGSKLFGKVKKEAKKSSPKKTCPKKTVLVKKSAVAKKFITKKMKLVKSIGDGELVGNDDDCAKKLKKKTLARTKIMSERKLKLEKQTKTKLAHKYTKASATTKKEEKSKNVVEKAVVKKKSESKECDKGGFEKKAACNEEDDEILNSDIKREIVDDKECEKSREEVKKVATKSTPKSKKVTKKPVKGIKENSVIKDGDSSDEQSKADVEGSKVVCKTKQENGDSFFDLNLKVEESSSESNVPDSDDSEDYGPRRKSRSLRRKDRSSSPEERSRRMRLFGFWSGPKRHRVASLNALAKVHCLYENEAGGVYLGGFCKPKPEKDKEKEKERIKKCKEEKEEKEALKKEKEKDKEKEREKTKEKEKESSKQKEKKVDTNTPKRKLRKVPGLRGKHWEMSAEMSSSSSSDEDYESDKEKVEKEPVKKPPMKQRKKKHEETMDLKDMVVCKRMASLNASAILAASYSDEKHLRGSSSSETSSSDSEVEIIKRRKYEYDYDKKKARQSSDIEEVVKPSNKVVIVNQDTDVTITGVYVNQTRSTHHEGFCSIAGMQYRISSTSHTQTAATAVATELREQKLEQPCKSYTPLGALSSMTVPGVPGGRANMSPRRHSAFSAPHQHGYYQPAGPLIQHPSTLPPIKGPPPDTTPTPPQNSEGSDDLVTPLSTSGGNSSAGGAAFYRAYCPQYYGTPPQYPELCYPPTYTHAHPHAPPYYKYTPYRRQYYGYQESGGTGGPTGASGAPGVVEYQPPLPSAPGDYSLPPYYSGYPPPPPPPPPPQPNPAYLHSQGRAFVDHAAFQSCPCPMQSCPKNVDTGPLIGNGKGAPVVSGPGLSLPPSALVGPPSPARGRAGLAPPHGANAWDTDRVQHNNHRSHKSQNQSTLTPANNHVAAHNHHQNSNCLSKDDNNCVDGKLRKCGCQKHACTSTCDVKLESLSPTEKLSAPNCPSLKMENNNVKCESCSMDITENIACVANCNVKCESEYKCESLKCEQCAKACLIEMDKDSGIVIDDKLENDAEVKEELSDVVIIDNDWKKPDYEPTVTETVEEDRKEQLVVVKSQQLSAVKRKLAVDGQPDLTKKRKISKKTVDTAAEVEIKEENEEREEPAEEKSVKEEVTKKKAQKKKSVELVSAAPVKKPKVVKVQNNVAKVNATDSSIMETINAVVMKSLQMTQKKEKETKKKQPLKKKPKSDKENVIVKKIANKLKNVVAEKINNIKNATEKKVSLDESQVQKPVSEKIQVAKVEKTAGEKVSLSKATTDKEGVSKTEGKTINLSKGKVVAKQKTKLPLSKTKNNVKFKTQEVKDAKNVKVQDTKEKKEVQVKNQVKPKANEVTEDSSKMLLKKKKVAKKATKKVLGKTEECTVFNENLTVAKKLFAKPKWSNGWNWEGEPYEAKVYLTNEESAIRRCYASMRHTSGDVLRPRDCVLLKSGPRKADLPYVAKIAALWENPEDGEMMFSLLWYYRPEHTEQGRTEFDTDDEVFASRHRDANSVACIEDKCYILTFNEYCRYRKNLRRIEEGLESPGLIVPPGHQTYPRESRQPPIPVPSDMVLFCRRVYDYRGKKLVKNPG